MTEEANDVENYKEYGRSLRKFENMPYYENIDHSHYLSMYIGSYIQKIFKAEYIRNRGYSYWTLDYEGKKLRVRHLSSCLHDRGRELSWNYYLDSIKGVDAIIFSAFGSVEHLDIKHLWFVPVSEISEIEIHRGNIKGKTVLEFRYNKEFIKKLQKYEKEDKLSEIKDVMRLVREDLEKKKKDNIFRKIIDKRKEIYYQTGIKLTNLEILEKAIKLGINTISDDMIKEEIKNENNRK